MNRRSLILGLASTTVFVTRPRFGMAAAPPSLEVYRNPGCGCCEGWVQYMQAAGFAVSIHDDPELDARRARLGIPADLASCHIALTNGYAFEGHIPPQDIIRFLSEPPRGAIGLVVPGMPAGSPGMGPEGSGGPYDVLLLVAGAAPAVYASH
jgi:hypothetical protein